MHKKKRFTLLILVLLFLIGFFSSFSFSFSFSWEIKGKISQKERAILEAWLIKTYRTFYPWFWQLYALLFSPPPESRFPIIKTSSLSLGFSGFEMLLYLRKGVYCIKVSEDCYLADDSLYVFSRQKDIGFKGIKIEGINPELGKFLSYQGFLLELFSELQKTGIEFTRVVFSEDRVEIESKEGPLLYFTPKEDLYLQLQALRVVRFQSLRERWKKLQYVDFRFPPRVFYREKGVP